MTTPRAIEKREGAITRPERTRAGRVYTPSVDILETGEELTLLADIPGARPEDIDIQYERGELSLRVKVDAREPEGERGVLLREYGVGDYYRVFEIGEGIDKGRIHAEVHNGVLTLHLPKVEEVKPRKIAVKTA